jgi:hypothetical protein
MPENWVKVYGVSQEYEAEMVTGLLKENEIDCVVINKKDSAYLFGELEIFVDVENAFLAKQIITKLTSE